MTAGGQSGLLEFLKMLKALNGLIELGGSFKKR